MNLGTLLGTVLITGISLKMYEQLFKEQKERQKQLKKVI